MNRTILVFGLIAGAIVSMVLVAMMLLHKSNPNTFDWGELVGYTSMLLAFSLVFIGIKSYRDRYGMGAISFKQGFLLGLGITLIASVLYTVTWVILYKTVYPNFQADYTRIALEKMQADGKSAADMARSKKEFAQMFSYYDTWLGLIGITFMEIFPIGLVVSLLCALILKRSQPDHVSTAVR